jgi:rhodanese-related sulfurtransferase
LEDALFVDVREPWEWDLVRLPDAVHLPLREVVRRKNELPRDRPLVVYCHAGIRSLRAVEDLRAAGFSRAVSLQGGIDRWAVDLDPNLPRY